MTKTIQISKKILSMILVICLMVSGLYTGSQRSFATGENESTDARPIDDGVYEIMSDIQEVSITGDSVSCLAPRHRPNQRFYFQFDEKKKTYTIRSLYSGKYLGAKKENGKVTGALCQAPKSAEYYQDWIVSQVNGDNVIELKTESERLAIYKRAIRDDEAFFTTDKEELDSFYIRAVDLSGGVYEITSPSLFGEKYSVFDTTSVNVSTGKGLGIRERNGYANQKFYIERRCDEVTKKTYYTIMCMYPRMLLGVDEKGDLICKNKADDFERYRWDIKQTDDGYVKIRSKSTGKMLEMKANNICLCDENKTNNQKFMFYSVDEFSSDQLISRGSDKEQVIEVRKSESNSRIVVDKVSDKKILQQGFTASYIYTNGSYVIESFEIGALSSKHSKVGALSLCDEHAIYSNSNWVILKFNRDGKDYVSYVLLSSLENSEKKSEYLSMDAPEGLEKDLMLTDKPLNGNVGTQSFQIIDIDANDELMDLLDERFAEDTEKISTPLLFLPEEEYEPVEEPKELDTKDLEKEDKISKSLSVKDLEEKYPEYKEYLKLVAKIMDPKEKKPGPEVMKKQGKDLEIIAQKLSYVYQTINSSPDVKHLEEYPVQMLAVIKLVDSVLNPGNKKGSIGEVKTGEGKSFIVMLSALILQSYGRKVDIVTTNMALVKRDCEEQSKYYRLFDGVTSGFLYNKSADASFRDELNDTPGGNEKLEKEIEEGNEKKKCVVSREYNVEVFDKDIVYSTTGNYQWVHLYNMIAGTARNRKYDVCIVDEADDVLLDGASNPALLAETFPIDEAGDVLNTVYNRVKAKPDLKAEDERKLKTDLENATKPKPGEHVSWENQGPGAKFDEKEIKLMVEAARKALKLEKDKDYICKDGKVVLVDKNTGFILPNTKLHAYIHEMIEIKEGMQQSVTSVTSCEISPLTFFNGYANLIGVTGTAGEAQEENLYDKLYQLETFRVPTNREIQRDVVMNLMEEDEDRYAQLEKEIKEVSGKGQPVLAILDSIKATDQMSKKFPEAHLIQGKNIDADKRSIDLAGRAGAVTLSTIAAGRGTDIKLTKEALDAGGLHVIVVNLPARSRTLMQNIGRCSRQGQPGSATVYVKPSDGFNKKYDFSEKTINLYKIQEKFFEYIRTDWKSLLEVDRQYYSIAKYHFGATVEDILEANEKILARRFFWPGKKLKDNEILLYMSEEECKMYLNMVYDMLLKAWGKVYTDLSRDPKSKKFDYCKEACDEFIEKIKKWRPKDENGNPLPVGDWIKIFAQKHYPGLDKNFGEEVFHQLYEDWHSDETIEEFIIRLFKDPWIQMHMSNAGISTWIEGITDEKLNFLPIEHQTAYKEFIEKYNQAMAKYHRDVRAYYERLELIARIKGENANIDQKLIDLEADKQRTEAQMIDDVRSRNEQAKARIRQEALDKMPEKFKMQILAASASGGGGGEVEVDLAAIDNAIGGFESWSFAFMSVGLSTATVNPIAGAGLMLVGAACKGLAWAEEKNAEQSKETMKRAENECCDCDVECDAEIAKKKKEGADKFAQDAANLGAGRRSIPKMFLFPRKPNKSDFKDVGRDLFFNLSIEEVIWSRWGDPHDLFEKYRKQWIRELEQSFRRHLTDDELTYIDVQVSDMIINKVKKVQEEYKEAYKKIRIIAGVNKSIDGAVKLGAMVAPVTKAFKSVKILAPATTISFGSLGAECGLSDMYEGFQDIYAAVTGEGLDKPSRNFAREAIGEKAYPWVEGISMFVTSIVGSKLCLQEESASGSVASEAIETESIIEEGFKPPKVWLDKHGKLTNGRYTINDIDMRPHLDGTYRKSQFLFDVDAEKAVLDAAAYADEHNLWIVAKEGESFASKAKVYVRNGYVGVTGEEGKLTHWINLYRKKSGSIHGCPGNE